MTIRFRCKCGRKFEVADSAAGRKARCTDCGLTFLVPSPNAHPAAAQPDNSPLAQVARAAQAAAAANASPAAHPAQSPKPPAAHAARPSAPRLAQAPKPPAAQAARPHAPRPAQAPQPPAAHVARPSAPRPAQRPATPPPVPGPAAHGGTYALQNDDDDVPMARLAPEPVHHARTMKLTAIHAVAGISTVVALVVIVDSVATMLGAIQAQGQGMDLIYGVYAIFAGIGIIVAMAAGAGSRICIGILLGGAARNVLNGPALMFMAFSKSEVVTSQGKDAVMVWGVAGVVSLLAGIAYLLAPLLSKSVRKYIGGHLGLVIGGGMVGLLLGPLVVSTALPDPLLVWARSVTARRVQVSTASGPGGAPVVLTPKQQTESREAMITRMQDIHKALSEYVQSHYMLPAHLGQLVSDEYPVQMFYSPTRGDTSEMQQNPGGGDIKDPDVIYLFKEGRSATQLESIPSATAAALIVAYSGPKCGLGEGAIVIRLPGVQVAAPVEWLDKPALDKQLEATNKWLKANPPPPKDNTPEKLPGFETP